MYQHFKEHYETIFPLNPSALSLAQSQIQNQQDLIVDLGCGTGELLAQIKSSAPRLGLDLEPEFIARAQARDPSGSYACRDLCECECPQKAQLIFSFGNVVSHLSPEQFQAWVNVIERNLISGGRWIFHCIHWDRFKGLKEHHYPDLIKAQLKFKRSYLNICEGSCDFATSLWQDEEERFHSKQKLFTHSMSWLLEQHSGFELKEQWANYQQSPCTEQDISRVYVFQKKS